MISDNIKLYKPASHFASPIMGTKMLCQSCYNSTSEENLNVFYFEEIMEYLPPPLFFLRSLNIYNSSGISDYLSDLHKLYLFSQNQDTTLENDEINQIIQRINFNN